MATLTIKLTKYKTFKKFLKKKKRENKKR